jgi:hypothetical protein
MYNNCLNSFQYDGIERQRFRVYCGPGFACDSGGLFPSIETTDVCAGPPGRWDAAAATEIVAVGRVDDLSDVFVLMK